MGGGAGVVPMQLGALVLLALYLLTAAFLLPRELGFLRGVDATYRRQFIIQDVLIQLSILLVLIPCTVSPVLGRAGLTIVMLGFGFLWLSALWMAISRYSYTYKVLLGPRTEQQQRLKEIFERLKEEDRNDG